MTMYVRIENKPEGKYIAWLILDTNGEEKDDR
jgi:hypothetical protein